MLNQVLEKPFGFPGFVRFAMRQQGEHGDIGGRQSVCQRVGKSQLGGGRTVRQDNGNGIGPDEAAQEDEENLTEQDFQAV